MTPDIAPAAPTDLAAVFALLEANGLPRAGLDEHLATTLVARDRGRLVGCAALELYGRAALLRSVAVAAPLRGRGVGQALTSAALALARGRGVRTVYLLTETAAQFFPKFGFAVVTRASVEPAVLQSTEFTTACPASALVMALAF